MNKKLIFFDIDGTLSSEVTGEIPESTKKAIAQAKENGHKVFINTGRTYFSIGREFKDMGFDGYICGCGTHIYYHGKKLLNSEIPHDLCVRTGKLLRKNQVPVFYEADRNIFFDFTYPNPWLEMAREMFGTQGRDIEELFADESLTYDKCLIFLKPEQQEGEIKKFLDSNFYGISRGEGIWEVTQREYTKATGIQFMCDYLNADIKDSFAVGDSENDLDMLKAAGTSIAMGNGKKEIMAYCDYVTKPIDQDGIYHALKHFRII